MYCVMRLCTYLPVYRLELESAKDTCMMPTHTCSRYIYRCEQMTETFQQISPRSIPGELEYIVAIQKVARSPVMSFIY